MEPRRELKNNKSARCWKNNDLKPTEKEFQLFVYEAVDQRNLFLQQRSRSEERKMREIQASVGGAQDSRTSLCVHFYDLE